MGGSETNLRAKGKKKEWGPVGGAEQARGAAFLDQGPGWGIERETGLGLPLGVA